MYFWLVHDMILDSFPATLSQKEKSLQYLRFFLISNFAGSASKGGGQRYRPTFAEDAAMQLYWRAVSNAFSFAVSPTIALV